jgi:hypothetical protein
MRRSKVLIAATVLGLAGWGILCNALRWPGDLEHWDGRRVIFRSYLVEQHVPSTAVGATLLTLGAMTLAAGLAVRPSQKWGWPRFLILWAIIWVVTGLAPVIPIDQGWSSGPVAREYVSAVFLYTYSLASISEMSLFGVTVLLVTHAVISLIVAGMLVVTRMVIRFSRTRLRREWLMHGC